MASGFDMKILGVAETMRSLRRIDPEMASEIRKAMKKPGMEIAKKARTYVHPYGLSNWGFWRGGYDRAAIKRRISPRVVTSKRKGSKGALLRVLNQDAAGAIWEMAGRKSRGKTPQGAAMIRNIEARGGPANRLMYRAFDETDQGGVKAELEEAVKRAEARIQQYLDATNAALAPTRPASVGPLTRII
jgi:hypothetical protein